MISSRRLSSSLGEKVPDKEATKDQVAKTDMTQVLFHKPWFCVMKAKS
jgi:hypothetical protein